MTKYKFTLGQKTCAPEGETACLGLWARQTAGAEPPRPALPEPATGRRQSPAAAARRRRCGRSAEPAAWWLWIVGRGAWGVGTPGWGGGGHWDLRSRSLFLRRAEVLRKPAKTAASGHAAELVPPHTRSTSHDAQDTRWHSAGHVIIWKKNFFLFCC